MLVIHIVQWFLQLHHHHEPSGKTMVQILQISLLHKDDARVKTLFVQPPAFLYPMRPARIFVLNPHMPLCRCLLTTNLLSRISTGLGLYI